MVMSGDGRHKSSFGIDLEQLHAEVYSGLSLEHRYTPEAYHCRTCGDDMPTFKARKHWLKPKYYVLVKWPDGHCAWIEDFEDIKAATDWIRLKSAKWLAYRRLSLKWGSN